MFWRIVFLSLLPHMDSTYVGITNISLLNITRAQYICRMIQSSQTLLALNYVYSCEKPIIVTC